MIVLGLGSNMGEREQNLEQALGKLDARPEIKIVQTSSIFETAPFGNTDQADFLNMTAAISTKLPPLELLKACLAVEQTLGRIRMQRWGPRVIDIDLLVYDAVVISIPELTLPHPGMLEREFVMIPLFEMAPGLVLPNGRTVAEIVAGFRPDTGKVRPWRRVVWDSSKRLLVYRESPA